MHADHYCLLGVEPTADTGQIRTAYLRLMRSCHPDVRPGDPAAGEVARRANLAWRTLRDPRLRAAYDRQLAAAAPSAVPAPGAAASPSQAAYLRKRQEYGKAFHRACLRVAAAVFASGVLLLAVTAR